MKIHSREAGCGFEEALIGYIYGEASAEQRLSFEKHSKDCTKCSTELVSFRELRLGLNTLASSSELAGHLANPAAHPKVEATETGLLKSFFGFFSLTPQFSAAAVAILAIMVATIFVLGPNNGETSQTDLASNKGQEALQVEPAVEKIRPAGRDESIGKPVPPAVNPNASPAVQPVKKRLKPTRAKGGTPTADGSTTTLSDVESADEDSLRLSDLFAELGVE